MVQEFGRAGRDGRRCRASLIFTTRDIAICQFMLDKSFPEPKLVQLFIDVMCSEIATQNKFSSEQEFLDLVSSRINEKKAVKSKKIDTVYKVLLRDKVVQSWQSPVGFEIDINDRRLEAFYQEYELRHKITHDKFRDVLQFVERKNSSHADHIEQYFL